MLHGQTPADALRYSSFDVSGTARTIGVGGGLGALGADFSVVSTNPAGLAMYRSSEFVVSPSIHTATSTSILEGGGTGENKETKNKFSFSNIGYVSSSKPSSRGSKWKTSNIAVGLNQIANFNRTFFYSGNTEGSYADRFVELAYDEFGSPIPVESLDQFEAGLAYSTGAIFDGSTEPGDQWINDFQDVRDQTVYKEQLVKTTGAINELSFSFAGNYNERLMVGASVGLPFVNFTEEKIYLEEDPDDEIGTFVKTEFREDLNTSGIGVNFKLGLIYRLNQMIRVGGAVHSPTSYTLTDNFSTELNYIFDIGQGAESFTDESPDGVFEYKMKTPWRYIGSAGVLIDKKGFLTAEVEYLNYGGASVNLTENSSDPGDAAYQDEVNDEITQSFTSAINIKIGGEYAYNKFRFRAGYGIYGTPYADDEVVNNSFSLGLGLRQERIYVDLAFRRLIADEGYVPYRLADPSNNQLVSNSINNDRVVLTFGFKF